MRRSAAALAAVLLAGCDAFPLEVHPPADAKQVRWEHSDEGNRAELSFVLPPGADDRKAIADIEAQLRGAGFERCARPGAWHSRGTVATVGVAEREVRVMQVRAPASARSTPIPRDECARGR